MNRKIYCALGYMCNNDCRICAVDSKARHDSNLSCGEIIRFLKESLDSNPDIRIVEFSGGEPTVRADLFEIMEWVYENYPDKKHILFSNGRVFADAGLAQRVSNLPVDDLIVAVHGKDAETHDWLTQRQGSFNETMAGIHNLLISGANVTIKIIPTLRNYRQIPDIVRMVISKFPEARKMSINGLDVQGGALENADDVFVRLTDAIPYIQSGLDLASANRINICTYSIPRCLFDEGHRKYVGIQPNRSYKYKSPSHVLEDKRDYNGHSPDCFRCMHFRECAGCWGTYIDYFGSSELKPIIGDGDEYHPGDDIIMDVTGRCNNGCQFCLAGGSNDKSMNIDEAKRKVDAVLKSGGRNIILSGGEPTAYEGLFELIDYIKSKDLGISIITNGRALKDDSKAKIIAGVCRNVTVDLFGHKAEIHDAITRRSGSFVETVKGIRNLLDAGANVKIKVIVNKINSMFLPDVACFVKENLRGANSIVFSSINIIGDAERNRDMIVARVSECAPEIEKAIDIIDGCGMRCEIDMFPYCAFDAKYHKNILPKANKSEKSFLVSCKGCMLAHSCPGYWKSYVDIYGDSEFRPIRSDD